VPVNEENLLYKFVPDILHQRVDRHWQGWVEACQSIQQNPQANIDLSLLGKIWACSEFIAITMQRNPQLWFELIQAKSLELSFSSEDYQQQLKQRLESDSGLNDMALMKRLRLFRAQQMLRIAWRDLADIASTTETLHNLTDLAETCVDTSLEILYQDQCRQLGVPLDAAGNPQRLVVLGMGKLGGYELNFSSDIDLIFCFAEEGEVSGARSLANSQFFIRLGQRFIKVLNDISAEGFVFRVDMRLRPYGESGPLVMSHGAMEQYYQTQGRDWERYAMIKARVIGGDRIEGQAIMDMLKPFVFRRYLDFGAFESIREMKAMINAEIRRKGNLQNIKLGAGGIREIEFIGQTFQLLRGGSDPELQARGILDVLKLLAEKKYLSPDEADLLTQSYDFLRRLENRLQMYADAQTHLLPEDKMQQASMALAMGYASWPALLSDCDKQRQLVQTIFTQLLHDSDDATDHAVKQQDSIQSIWLHQLDADDALQILEDSAMANAAAVLNLLQKFQNSSQLKAMTAIGRQRLDTLMPALLESLLDQPDPAEVLQRLLALLQSILKRSVYLSLLNEYPQALKQLLKLFAASPWIAQLVSRYPVLLDELLDPQNLYQVPTQLTLKQELDHLLAQVAGDEEQQIERLRKFKQAQVLKIAAMDIAGVLDVFAVSEQLSNIAATLLEKVMDLAWGWMIAKHGRPGCVINAKNYQPTMAVVAYGKMGGREMGYGSDLDLVFLHDSQGKQQQTDGKRTLDNASFFARMAQRVIHLLSLQTANGRLYETDMRLRPDGNAGLLVSSVQAYDRYQHEKAWTWEHQALVRARILCSSEHLQAEFDRIRSSVLIRQRDKADLAADVAEMRRKMRESLGSTPASGNASRPFHLKQDAGGLVDIEFIAQFGVLVCAAKDKALTQHTATRKILMQLSGCELLSKEQAECLYDAYRDYRSCSHQRALQQLSSLVEDSAIEKLSHKVKDIWLNVIEKHISHTE